MSYFEDASLVLIPSAQKLSKIYSVKPTDGTGDLTFTRSNDTATRVGPDGLIEKVRTNVALYSEQFDNAVWNKYNNATATANSTTAPNGTTTADTYGLSTASTTFPNIAQDFGAISGVEYAFSVYAKKNVTNFIKLRVGGTAFSTSTNSPIFNLNTGTVVSGTGTIESVGNGWYRCSFYETAVATATGGFALDLPDANGVWSGSSVYTASDSVFIWGFQTQTGPVATAYIATTTAAVSVGPVANVPRLDYLNSSCPRLLLEPQRTNLFTFSEQINNSAWTIQGLTIAANSATSPDGYQNADLLDDGTAASTQHWFFQGTTLANSTTYTLSLYAKYVSRQNMTINIFNGVSSQYVDYNIQNGTIVGSTGDVTASITSVGNGWYRLTYTRTMAATGGPNYRIGLADDTGSETYTGSNKQTLIYGCQLEAGAYATSYIPTLGAAVTRGADAASKTGISSLIGQTEGTLFVEFVWGGHISQFQSIEIFGNSSNRIGIYSYDITNTLRWFVIGSGSAAFEQNVSSALVIGQRYKLAIAYKSGSSEAYLNGVQTFSTVATFAFNNALNDFYYRLGSGIDPFFQPISQTLLFKTRLTNAQLAELTTI